MYKTNFIPIDYDYFDYHSRNHIKIIGRTDKGKKICIIDEYTPYFWVILKNKTNEKKIKLIQKKIEKFSVEKSGRKSKIIKTELHKKKYLGNDVNAIKVFVTNFKDAHALAHEIDFTDVDKIREYDINIITKYIIDKKIKPFSWYEITGEILNNSLEFGGIDSKIELETCIKLENYKKLDKDLKFNPKILAFDIETDEFEIGKGEILMVSLYSENFKKVITQKKSSKLEYVEKVNDEEELIEKFIETVKKFDPDILVGYFSDGFDLPYLKARAEKLHINFNIGVDGSGPRFTRGNYLTGKIKGIVHLDLIRFIRIVYGPYMQSETLTLNDVSNELLGEKKLEFEFKPTKEIKDSEWEQFYKYNLKDSELTYRITKKIWPDLLEFSLIVGEPLFDVTRDSMSTHVENYIMHKIQKYNEIIEKRPLNDEISKRRALERYVGGYVLQPEPGIYDNVVFFDFTSMYASIIITYNISSSTYREKPGKNLFSVNLDGKYAYFTKKQGFFPLILSEIIKLRKKSKIEYKEKKDILSKAKSNAFKLLANASYGYLGFAGARYFRIEAAASTAALARKSIKKAIKTIENNGHKVIYSDTDSIAFKQEKKSNKEINELLKDINSKLPGIMELDLEGFFKRGIWVTTRSGEFGAKKKYALIDKDNKLKIRGFETVRRDWCNLARDTQNKVLESVLKDGNEKAAITYLKKIIKSLKERKIDKKELMIRTQLKKPIEEYKSISPHVEVAKKMKSLKMPVNIGMLIKYYIAEPNNKKKTLIRERAKLPDEKGDYDIEYYLKNQILPSVENILDVFNINLNELIDGKKQTSLGDF